MLSESLQHGPALQQSAPSTTGHARRENATESHDSGLVSGEKLEGQSSTGTMGSAGPGKGHACGRAALTDTPVSPGG